jgi:predicted transcriptional regulator YdeE
VPPEFTNIEIPSGRYALYEVSENIPEIVINTWQKIYSEKGYKRNYSADFDIYSANTTNPEETKLKVYVSIH